MRPLQEASCLTTVHSYLLRFYAGFLFSCPATVHSLLQQLYAGFLSTSNRQPSKQLK